MALEVVIRDWSNSAANRILALHMTGIGLIPSTSYSPLSPPDLITVCRKSKIIR